MRHVRVAIITLFIGVIAITFTCGLLATDAPCISAPASPTDTAGQLARLDAIEPGERFELLLTPADINAYLAGYLHTHTHAILNMAVIAYDENCIIVDLCVHDILFRPVPIHAVLTVEQGEQTPQLTCTEWSIGRITMPHPAHELLSRRLNAELAKTDAYWHIEQWKLEKDSLQIVIVRRQ